MRKLMLTLVVFGASLAALAAAPSQANAWWGRWSAGYYAYPAYYYPATYSYYYSYPAYYTAPSYSYYYTPYYSSYSYTPAYYYTPGYRSYYYAPGYNSYYYYPGVYPGMYIWP